MCCKPLVSVSGIDTFTFPGYVIWWVDELFTNIGYNKAFDLVVSPAQTPATAFDAPILITDGITRVNASVGCTGNRLRSDALRKTLLNINGCSKKCVTLHCFFGFDANEGTDNPDGKIVVNNRVCPSAALNAVPPATEPAAAPVGFASADLAAVSGQAGAKSAGPAKEKGA